MHFRRYAWILVLTLMYMGRPAAAQSDDTRLMQVRTAQPDAAVPANVAVVRQAATAEMAVLSQAQTGSGLRAEIVVADDFSGTLQQIQLGTRHEAFITVSGDAVVIQRQGGDVGHDGNIAEVAGLGSGADVTQVQLGSRNTARLLSADGRTAVDAVVTQRQEGSRNELVVQGFFSADDGSADTYGARFSLAQYGDHNTAAVRNHGQPGNQVDLLQRSNAAEPAHGNTATVDFQTGDARVSLTQIGHGNRAVVTMQ